MEIKELATLSFRGGKGGGPRPDNFKILENQKILENLINKHHLMMIWQQQTAR